MNVMEYNYQIMWSGIDYEIQKVVLDKAEIDYQLELSGLL